MTAVPLLLILFGSVLIVGFALDLTHTASRLARTHSELARRFPRYYAITDPWRLSTRRTYWRFLGAILGGGLLVIGAVLFVVAVTASR